MEINDILKTHNEKSLPIKLKGSYRKVYVPTCIQNKKRNHYEKKEWVNVYFYIDPATLKEKYSIEFNLPIVVDKKYHRKETLYKVCDLSKKDKLFDYYRILKSDLKDKGSIAIERRRNRYNNNLHMHKKEPLPKSVIDCPNDNPLKVDFQ